MKYVFIYAKILKNDLKVESTSFKFLRGKSHYDNFYQSYSFLRIE